MNADEIRNEIYKLKTDIDIENFVKNRINYLEENSIEKIVGQNYTDIFRNYISKKTHYKPAASFKEKECPDLVYDDLTPYIMLVKRLIKEGYYDSKTILNTIYYNVKEYLPVGDELDRYFIYKHSDKVSIKKIHEMRAAFCSERAGLAQNMFKFLGFSSIVISGKRNGVNHAYNAFYPKGYDTEIVVLFDSSHSIKYLNKDGTSGFNLVFYEQLSKREFDEMLMGLEHKSNLEKTNNDYRKLYGNSLKDYEW